MEMKLLTLQGRRLPYTLTWAGRHAHTHVRAQKDIFTKNCKAYIHAGNDLILIVLAQFCIQKQLHALKNCFSKQCV